MTDFPITPCDIVADFLRRRLTDPRARAEVSDSDSFTAAAAQTEFTLTPTVSANSVSCITSVTVNAAAKTKWTDYFWDYQNQKITFKTAMTGGEAVVVNYKAGSTNWIFSDKPDVKLSPTSWPRISIWPVSGSGTRMGTYSSQVMGNVQIQIDVWSKNGYVVTISGRKYSNHYLTQYLGYKITEAFETYESDLFPILFDYVPIGLPRAAGFTEEYQAFHSIVEAGFNGLSLGKITL